MTIAVTPHAETSPPSNAIALSLPVGSITSEVSLWRDDPTGRTYIDVAAGFDSRTVTDYFCPYGVQAVYGWETTYFDPTAGSTLFYETWPNVTSWPNAHIGTFVASGGEAVTSSTGAQVQMARSFTAGHYRVTIDSLTASGTATATLRLREESDGIHVARYVQVALIGGVVEVRATGISPVNTTIDPSQPFTVDFFEGGSVVVTGVGDNVTLFLADINLADIFLQAGNVTTVGQVSYGPIRVQDYAAPITATEYAAPVALEPAEAWLIHPGQVNLSMPLSADDSSMAGLVDIDPIENASNTTVHRILGSASPITTKTGPRGDDRTALTLITVTTAEAAQLTALTAGDYAVFVQFPAAWDLDFNNGYYLFGDIETIRTEDFSARRIVRVPVRKTQRQAIDTVNTGWSYAQLLNEFGNSTYADLLDVFATYADMATNTR